MGKENIIPQVMPWAKLPFHIYKWTQEQVFRDGLAQNYGSGNYAFFADEVDSINEWLIPNIKDKVFYDVGANIGLWSCVAVLCGAKEIHMFEPGAQIKEAVENVCRASEEVGRSIDVYPLQEAIGASSKSLQYNSWLEECQIYEDAITVSVTLSPHSDIESLDDYVAGGAHPPDYIKIDTEGAEWAILEGAQNLIKRFRPQMMIESHNGSTRDNEIIELASAGQKYNVAPIKDLSNHRHVYLF